MSEEKEKTSKRKKSKSFLYSDLSYGPKEAFKRLRSNVICSFDDDVCHVIGLTSALASEGKSLISINLASSLAEIGKKVILLDGDVYRPSIHKTLNVSSEMGIAEMTKEESNVSVAVHKYPVTETTYFDFIATGEVPDNPSQVLNSQNLLRLMDKLREAYDYVIIDMPPIGSVSDVAAFSRLTDGMLIVVHEEHTPKLLLRECVDQLRFAKINIMAFVMNGSLSGGGSGYSYSYGGRYSRYGYGYYRRKKDKDSGYGYYY